MHLFFLFCYVGRKVQLILKCLSFVVGSDPCCFLFFFLQKHPQGRKRVQLVSDDEDDVPLKARPAAKARGGDESSDDDDGAAPPCLEDSDDDTPLKVKVVNGPCL